MRLILVVFILSLYATVPVLAAAPKSIVTFKQAKAAYEKAIQAKDTTSS